MKFEWEVWSDEENDGFYIRKMVYMCVPKEYPGYFETEEEAQGIADYLNKRDNVDKTVDKKTIINVERK